MVKKSITFIFLFLFSCSSNTDKSFEMLEEAFSNWYAKNHYYNIKFLNSTQPYNIHLFNKNQLNEYYADLNRFSLELTQIDVVKLSYENHVKFNVINDVIENLSFKYENLPYGDIFVYKAYFQLFNTLESQEMKMHEKIDIIFENIKEIKSNIESIIKFKNVFIYNKLNFDKNFTILLNYINNIPIRVNAEPKILDNLEAEIKTLKKDLINFKKIKINNDYKILIKSFAKYNHFKSNISNTIDLKSYYKEIQNKLFTQSYNIYIKENDEPIWVDEKDTLDVIRWVVDNKLNNNQKNKSNLIQSYYENLYKIDDYLAKNKINIFKNDVLPSILTKDNDHHLFSNVYYINNTFYLDENIFVYNNNYGISKSIINDFYKEYFTNLTTNKSDKLYQLNYDKSYQTALSLLIQNILLDLNYHNNDSLYNVNMYLDILQIITCAINQQNLFEKNMSKNEIIENLKKHGFFNDSIIEEKFSQIFYLSEFYIKTVLFVRNILNKYQESNYNFYNELQFENPKPYYLIK